MASASFQHVTKRFAQDEIAVKDMCLEVKDKEFMVVVGPSGCGKSTALRMLAGLEDVTGGVIMIGETVVNNVPSRNRDVAMVFQAYALYPHMSVFDNMAFGMRMQGVDHSEIERRVNRAADVVGLAGLLGRLPRQLSGGEQQRVALGRAIVRDPQLFLLDEPLSSLDAKLREHMRVELLKIHRTLRATFLFVTHDQVEAMTLGDRIAVMKDGVLQQVAPPKVIYEHPANMFVAGFIGTPAMNLIPVSVSGRTAKASALQIELPRDPGLNTAVLGIRPEALHQRASRGEPTIDMQVDLAEMLGRDQFVYGAAGDNAIVARLDPHLKIHRGERVQLGIDMQSIHLFDAQTGQAVL
ncbi:MAG TPA: sn-glycerol-3-phosphate ABC transporter ATP-binding protein UgpC [Candidatus Dormibacteraeota bacterium]|nr:sn-glycerol-3-phosphate ABC transporter ATP-binding protein UgpC [Candidatus Dormibacteraeota bacterium]